LIRSFAPYTLILIADIKHDYTGVREIHNLDKFDYSQKGVFRVKILDLDSLKDFDYKVFTNVAIDRSLRVILVYDELQIYLPNNCLQRDPYFFKMLTMGRAYGIGMWFASQRPQTLDKNVLSQSKYIISFFLDNKRDLDQVDNYIPSEKTRSLKKYWFYVYTDDKGILLHAPI